MGADQHRFFRMDNPLDGDDDIAEDPFLIGKVLQEGGMAHLFQLPEDIIFRCRKLAVIVDAPRADVDAELFDMAVEEGLADCIGIVMAHGLCSPDLEERISQVSAENKDKQQYDRHDPVSHDSENWH